MGNSKISLLKILLLASISTWLLTACSSNFAASMRKVTYPPDFKYTENTNLRSHMQRLAFQMSLLDIALIPGPEQTQNEKEIQREQVLSALRNMGRIAANLKAGDSGANHPFMEDYMKNLVIKIDEAKVAASFETPRYYFAGKVSGACVNCHKVNR